MSKLKEFLKFVSNKKSAQKQKNSTEVDKGKLQTDAVGVFDESHVVVSGCGQLVQSFPTASTEMTGQMVQQLTNPNYNSMDAVAIQEQNNTMNVNSAQQQLVMNFNNANNLHFGAVYNINNGKNSGADSQVANTEKPTKRVTPMKTTTVVEMMQCKNEPDLRMLDTIATHLGEGWKQVMRDLGHTEGQIEQAIIDHQMHGNIREVIYQLLLQWVRGGEDDQVTLGRITTILWQRKHQDIVQRMKIVWKETKIPTS